MAGPGRPAKTHPPRVSPGSAALVAAAAAIAIGTILSKEAYGVGAEPTPIATARLVLGGALMGALLPFVVSRSAIRGRRRELAQAVAAGAVLYVGSRMELEGLDRLPATIFIILLAVAPLWVALVEWALWSRRPGGRQIAAIAAVVVGVALLTGPVEGSVETIGLACGIGTSIAIAVLFLLLEDASQQVPTTVTVPVALVTAGLLALMLEPGATSELLGSSELAPYALGIGVAFFGWGLFFMLGLGSASALTAAILLSAEPLFVSVLAYLILDESLSASQILGCAVVLVGVAVVSLRPGSSAPARS